jgi:hypothetical protein
MQLIIDEIVNNVRAVERAASSLSADVMRSIVSACLDAVRDMMAKDERIKAEQSTKGPWVNQQDEAR